MSYTSIQAQIEAADDGASGLVPWVGTNGEKSILTNLNAAIRDKGIISVSDTTALAAITGNDTHFAVVLGLGFYYYNPNTIPSPAPTGSIVATGGGYWQIITTYGNEYRQTVDTSTGLTFTINHNIGYDYPNIRAIDAGTPHVVIPIATVSYTNANSLSVTFSGTYINKNIVIIVQP